MNTGEQEAASVNRSVFVGRARELGELARFLAEALAGRGRLVLLVGEPGAGKTRLADEAVERTGGAARVLWGRCWDGAGAPPFWLWTQLLRAFGRTAGSAALARHLGSSAPDMARILPEATDLVPAASDGAAASASALQTADPSQLRFRLFDVVASFFRSAAEEQPLVLVADDLHWADEASLLLLRFLARQIRDRPILVVGTYCDVETRLAPSSNALFAQLRREAHSIAVGGLQETEVATYINALTGRAAAPAVVAAVHDATDGNPFFVEEVVQLLHAEGHLGDRSPISRRLPRIPDGVRETIRRRLEPLGVETVESLRTAAVLGREFDLRILGRLMNTDVAPLAEAMSRAIAAGLLSPVDGSLGRNRFAHALIAETLYGDLPETRRTDLHRQIGALLATEMPSAPGSSAAEVAHHCLRGAAAGHVEAALDWAERAAQEALSRCAYETAADLYSQALNTLRTHEAGRADRATALRRAELLVRLGGALWYAGRAPAATDAFMEAGGLARAHREGALLARAALGVGAVRTERGRTDAALTALLEEALVLLGTEDGAWRCRVMARLARSVYLSGAGEHHIRLSQEAVDMARRLGDRGALAAALSARHAVLFGIDSTEERLDIASEVVRLASEAGDHELRLEGEGWRIHDLLELGDFAAAEAAMAVYERTAREQRLPRPIWYATVFRTMEALWRGRLEEAERRAGEGLAVRQAEETEPSQFYGVQMFTIRREQGRLREIAPALQELAAHYPALSAWRCVVALLYAELGDAEAARVEIETFAGGDLGAIPRDVNWLPTMTILAEICSWLGDAPRAEVLYRALEPFARRNVVVVGAVACRGAVAHYLGLLAASMQRFDEAVRHFEAAIEMHRRMRAWPALAASEYECARALGAAGKDPDRARHLRDSALARVAELRLTRLGKHIEAHAASAIPPPVAPATPSTPTVAEFRREGEYWTVAFDSSVLRLKDTKGLRYLRVLLGAPGREFHVLDLMAAAGDKATAQPELPEDRGDAGEVLDDKAVTAYRRRLAELQETIAAATESGDTESLANLQVEIDFLERQLGGGVGLGGRRRRVGSHAEQARVNVTKVIGGALKRIAGEQPGLGRHLDACIKTGTYCSYTPDPVHVVAWRL